MWDFFTRSMRVPTRRAFVRRFGRHTFVLGLQSVCVCRYRLAFMLDSGTIIYRSCLIGGFTCVERPIV